MRLLHAIMNGLVEAWVWAYAYGANGRVIGTTPTGRTQYHLYPAQRGLPYPLPDDTATGYTHANMMDRRRYWRPWSNWERNLDRDGRLTPLCGRLRSNSQLPRLAQASPIEIDPFNHPVCPSCLRQAQTHGITPEYISHLQQRDPWTTRRANFPGSFQDPDPVSGQ